MQAPDPKSLAKTIENWFIRHQRPLPWREAYDPYHVWVSEVMLQQTRMEVVLGFFDRFIGRFPTLRSLAQATEDEVMSAWSGLGYYRRAKMLRLGAQEVLSRFGGRVPSTVAELLTLPGVGRYTAGAIASVAHRQHAPIVDGNVARIVSRLFAIEHPLGTPALMREAWLRAEELVDACTSPRHFNQGLMEVGALICRPRKPSCLVCPVREHCIAARTGRADELPRPKVKKETRELRIDLYVVADANGRVLMRREAGPLMTSMYHLPHGDTSLLSGHPLRVVTGPLLGTFRHTVTTRKIEFAVYEATLTSRVAESNEDWAWIDPRELHAVPHPSYVRKALGLRR